MIENEVRDSEICKLYVGGLPLRQLGDRFGMSHERVRQILRKAGVYTAYRKKNIRTLRAAFLGINLTDEDKIDLCREAARMGVSMSALSSDWIKEKLAERKVEDAGV